MGTSTDQTKANKKVIKINGDEVTDIVELYGKFGLWHVRLLFGVILSGIPICWTNMSLLIQAPTTKVTCLKSANHSADWQVIEKKECEVIFADGQGVNQSLPCVEWDYDRSFWTETIVSEWDLVCSNSWLPSFGQSLLMFGYLVSTLVLSPISDRYGRKTVVGMCCVLMSIVSVAICFCTNYYVFAVFRFLHGMARVGISMPALLIVSESVAPESRPIFNLIGDMGWVAGYALVPALGWFLRDWKDQQIAVSLSTAFLVMLYWIIPESPRWLLSHGKLKRLEEVISGIAKMNGRELPPDLDKVIQRLYQENIQVMGDEAAESKKCCRCLELELVRKPKMRKITLVIFWTWLVNAFCYYALAFNVVGDSGNLLLNIFLSGMVELPASFISYFLISRIGRRMPFLFSTLLSGIFCALTIPVPKDSMPWLQTVFFSLGKMFVSVSGLIIFMHATELFPTVLRNIGMGWARCVARVGTMIAPFLKEFGQYIHKEAPMALIGGISIATCFLVLFLPETHNCVLPDTVEQAENFEGKKVFQKNKLKASPKI